MNESEWKAFLTAYNRELPSYQAVVEALPREAHGKTFGMAWQAAEYVAPIYVRRGNPDAAWGAIESNLKRWCPVGHAQVAPVILLIDEHMFSMMTPERCQMVLSTPRGPEGVKEK